MVSEFDGSTESIKNLETATKDVKTQFDAQRKAITALNTANRVQNFELIQGLRLLRSFSSMTMNLNSILQTSILRGIEQNQTTVAQRQAYKDLLSTMGDLVNATGILGSGNLKVQAGWKDMIANADSLNSNQLTTMIKNLKALAASGKLSGDDLAYLNEQIALLEEVLAEQNIEESTKQWNDFFGAFVQVASVAANVGLFTAALEKQYGVLSKLKGILPGAGGGGIKGAIPRAGGGQSLPFIISQFLDLIPGAPEFKASVGKQIRGGLGQVDGSGLDQAAANFFKNFVNKNSTAININMYDTKLNSDLDLERLAKKITDAQNQSKTINNMTLGG